MSFPCPGSQHDGADASGALQHSTREEYTMATPQLGVIGIVVADTARSLAFYRQLGLAVPQLRSRLRRSVGERADVPGVQA